ncbi:Putative pallbearer [Gryllus bimaculatus]|nr:Putative pallbearer [Gryllus bimaculatus]
MSELDLLNLPDIVLENIFSNLSYDEIARFRIVCKRFDNICKKLLNKGFIAAERFHAHSIKAVKVQLPRRESERRLHPLARHCDILSAIETRLSMLSMTFMKYVDVGLCCFIPGKVIDEIFRVLKYLRNCRSPPRAHEILQELRDISSMAMEHFDEKIAPGLKNARSSETFSPNSYPPCSSSKCPNAARPFFTQDRLRFEFQKCQRRDQRAKRECQSLSSKISLHKSRCNKQAKRVSSQAIVIAEQGTQIAELKRTIAEWDHKYGDVIAELSCIREENAVLAAALGIVFNRNKSSSKVSVTQPCTSRGTCEAGKRKSNEGGETSRPNKKSKAGKPVDTASEETFSTTKEKILNLANQIVTHQNGKVSDCLVENDEK